jgi:NAD(P)-dependent dehydrogenase (short-subunit alcohol dehydrogenase family)
MDLHLAGKVFVVSGGLSGIGAAIASVLTAEGATVATLDRQPGADETVDLAVEGAASAALSRLLDRLGRLDGLVNNAGVNDGVGLRTGDPAAFVRSLRANLVHYFELAQTALPHLIATRGAILNITSKVAQTGQGGTSGYAAANGGRNALTREWAVELAPLGVRVNAVVVAECFTPMYERWLATLPDPTARKACIESRIPLGGRMTTPEEIAHAAVFLLSEAASHITGQFLHVDGGYVHLDRAATP